MTDKQRLDKQTEVYADVINNFELRVRALKDDIRLKNQEILLLNLQIKNLKKESKNDQSKENQGFQTLQN